VAKASERRRYETSRCDEIGFELLLPIRSVGKQHRPAASPTTIVCANPMSRIMERPAMRVITRAVHQTQPWKPRRSSSGNN